MQTFVRLARSLSLRTAISLLLVGISMGESAAQNFDFETAGTSEPKGASGAGGGISSLVQSSGGLVMTITRQNNASFNIVDFSGGSQAPASWGTRSLDAFFGGGQFSTNGFIANFSSAITFFSMQFGDFAIPDVDILTLTAWSGLNGAGSMIAQVIVVQGAMLPTFQTAAVSGASFQSVTWSSTTQAPNNFPNSLYYDNFVTQGAAIPDAGSTVLLLSVALVSLSLVRRRRCAG